MCCTFRKCAEVDTTHILLFLHQTSKSTTQVTSGGRDRSGVLSSAANFQRSSTTGSLSIQTAYQQESMPLDSEMEDLQVARNSGNSRLHSFSLPKKNEVEQEAPIPPQSPTSSDRDDLEVTYEYSGSVKFPKPRYLQETLASINSRPRKSSYRTPVRRTTSYTVSGTKTASLPTRGGDTNPVFTKTMASTALGNHANMRVPKSTKGLDSMTPASKSLAGRVPRPTSAASSSTSSASRALFTANFTQPMSGMSIGASTVSGIAASLGLGGSIRRSFVESSDAAMAGGTGVVRPRTAPPRMRKKDIDTSDLLYSKKMDTSARAQPQAGDSYQQSSSRRARSSLDIGGSTSSSNSSAANNINNSSNSASTSAATAGKAPARRSTVGAAPVSASYSRAKSTTRAQWK